MNGGKKDYLLNLEDSEKEREEAILSSGVWVNAVGLIKFAIDTQVGSVVGLKRVRDVVELDLP